MNLREKETTETASVTSFFDIYLKFDTDGHLLPDSMTIERT